MGGQSSERIIRATHTPWPPAWIWTSSAPVVSRSIDTVSRGVGAKTTARSSGRTFGLVVAFATQAIEAIGTPEHGLGHVAHERPARCDAALGAAMGVAVQHEIGAAGVARLGQ